MESLKRRKSRQSMRERSSESHRGREGGRGGRGGKGEREGGAGVEEKVAAAVLLVSSCLLRTDTSFCSHPQTTWRSEGEGRREEVKQGGRRKV